MIGRHHYMCALIVAVCSINASAASADPAAGDHVRFSLATASDKEAWQEPGFRLGLGFAYGRLAGLDGAPSGRLLGPLLRMGMRLDGRWSLMSTLEYAGASPRGADGLEGLRFAGTLEPTLHLSNHVSVAVGLGFAGFLDSNGNRHGPDPDFDFYSSRTYPDARVPLASCTGSGAAAIARIDWMMVLGSHSSTGVALEVDGQWTHCTDGFGDSDPDTAEPIELHQFWPHAGVTASWVVLWR